MGLSKERRKQEIKIGFQRQIEGKHPVGWFPGWGVPNARRAGANLAKAQQGKSKNARHRRKKS
jgi:hypothetical protein